MSAPFAMTHEKGDLVQTKKLFALIFLLLSFLLLTSCALSSPIPTPTASPAPTFTPIPNTPVTNGGCSTVTAEPTANVSSGLAPHHLG